MIYKMVKILMTYASITDYNLTGLDIIFVYVNDVTGSYL